MGGSPGQGFGCQVGVKGAGNWGDKWGQGFWGAPREVGGDKQKVQGVSGAKIQVASEGQRVKDMWRV